MVATSGTGFTLLLLLLLLATAVESAEVVLPPEEECGDSALFDPLETEGSCVNDLLGNSAGPACCEAFDKVIGAYSTLPSANCLCIPEVTEYIIGIAASRNVDFKGFFRKCNENFEASIFFYQGEGVGQCFGNTDSEVVEERPPMRSFSEWVNGLDEEPVLLFSFIVALPSGLGFLLFLWTASTAILMT